MAGLPRPGDCLFALLNFKPPLTVFVVRWDCLLASENRSLEVCASLNVSLVASAGIARNTLPTGSQESEGDRIVKH